MLRLEYTDFDSANLLPTVDDGCETSVYEEAIWLDNAHPLNVSNNTPIATAANRADATGANSVENARAHRALLRGDDLYVGYTYTEDDALARLARPRANYNFWMRRFDAVTGTWASPKNLTGIRNRNVDAKEPRLMGTPGKGPNCPADPEDCQNTSVFFAVWGTKRKDPVMGAAADLDIFVTCTTDKGEGFVPAIRIGRGDNVNDQAEDQLRSTPDGSRVFSVWNERNRRGGADTRFTVGTIERSLGPPGKP
ncbi:MAG: choice-of-anchor O protein [Desulfobacterales bacterium]